ncbi:hypothetical protein [Sphingomonas sp. BK069]|nr:hypothetical protein [Sphingomonas sp. BK069]MBB3347764.1 hypothetical protein [Sphingomonas sp. BK069]
MRSYRLAALGAALALLSAPAAAQLTAEANGARAEDHWGGELGVGYGLGAAGFKLTPMVGAFLYAGDTDRYVRDDNGSNARCRDSATGRYADDDRCDKTVVKPYAKLEATYAIPLVATLGAGLRVSEADTTPYGTVAFTLAPLVKLKGNVGAGYYALGLRVGL